MDMHTLVDTAVDTALSYDVPTTRRMTLPMMLAGTGRHAHIPIHEGPVHEPVHHHHGSGFPSGARRSLILLAGPSALRGGR
jgi:hypothetical protein